MSARAVKRAFAWLKRHRFTLLFTLSILLLATLVTWWSVFLYIAIREQRDFSYANLKSSASVYALTLGQNRDTHPPLGVLAQDDRLQITTLREADLRLAAPLAPNWPGLFVEPRTQVLAEIEREFHRKREMVVGESAFLLLAILVTALMLHRMTWLERRSYREMQQLWSRVTHELKTPITGIKAFLQTMQQRDFKREELAPLLSMALREVERQEMLAENLLVGQRMDRPGFGLRLQGIKLPQYAREFLNEHRLILPGGRVVFTVACGEETEAVADPDALRVILENLTDNALKYGGQDPEVTYEVTTRSDHPAIVVSDRGMGFAPQDADAIFEAYQRLTSKQAQGRHGTGMGLYISRQLARRMGGDIQAQSEGPGRGARFVVTLRRA